MNKEGFWQVLTLCSGVMFVLKEFLQQFGVFAGYQIMPANGVSPKGCCNTFFSWKVTFYGMHTSLFDLYAIWNLVKYKFRGVILENE